MTKEQFDNLVLNDEIKFDEEQMTVVTASFGGCTGWGYTEDDALEHLETELVGADGYTEYQQQLLSRQQKIDDDLQDLVAGTRPDLEMPF